MERFRLAKVWEEDAYHNSCNHPPLPQNTTIVIDLDLKGHKDPDIRALQADLDPQEPDTARIFLCSSHTDARDIFRNLGMGGSERYVENIINDPDGPGSVLFQLDDREILVPYDPRRLFDWVSIVPGRALTLVVSEFVAIHGQPLAEQKVFHSQVRMSKVTDNRYRVIWFDFRNMYRGHRSFPTSIWQRCFAYRIHHQEGRLCEKFPCASDFPAYLLLEILETDMKNFEPLVLQNYQVVGGSKFRLGHVSTMHDYVTQRYVRSAFRCWMTGKAEGIHKLATYMNTPQVRERISEDQRVSFSRSSHQVETASSFLLSKVQQQDKDSEDLLALHSRIEQEWQASSMSTLTFSAALFLPLSLAASFLSMQNRARDLHLIAYDFVGITFIFLTIAALAYFGLQAYTKLMAYAWVQRQAGKTSLVPLMVLLWVWIIVSFFVGMFHRLENGVLILLCTGPLVIFLHVLLVLRYLLIKLIQRVRQMRDQERARPTTLQV